MADADIRVLQGMVLEHQAQIRVLSDLCNYLVQAHFAFRQRHADLSEQLWAMSHCLQKAGLVSQQDLGAQMRLRHSLFCFNQMMNEPAIACTIVLSVGLKATSCLLGSSHSFMTDILRALSEVADEVTVSSSWLDAPPFRAASESSLLVFLQDVWHHSALVDTLSRAMGALAVQQLRAASHTCRECMRPAHAKVFLWEQQTLGGMALEKPPVLDFTVGAAEEHFVASGVRGEASALRTRSGPQTELTSYDSDWPPLLQDICHYSSLVAELTHAMGQACARQFSAVSRSGWESMRMKVTKSGRGTLSLLDALLLYSSAGKGLAAKRSPESTALASPLRSVAASKQVRLGRPDSSGIVTLNVKAPSLGSLVILGGLKRLPELNGKFGRLVHPKDSLQRWGVLLTTGQTVRVRPANLQFVVPAPETGTILTPQEGSQPVSHSEGVSAVELPVPPPQPVSADMKGPEELPSSALCYSSIMELNGLAATIARFAGSREVRSFAATSQGLNTAINSRGKIYVCGGCNGREVFSSVECLDLKTGAWHSCAGMSRPRQGAMQAWANGRIYIFGGTDGYRVLNSMERFDPQSGEWNAMPAMSMPRIAACACTLNGCIYVCGGQYHVALSSVECFDPQKHVWSQKPRMAQQRAFPMVSVVQRCLYVYGGTDHGCLDSVEMFNPRSDSWMTLAPMSRKRCTAATACVGQFIYVCGGFDHCDLRYAERLDTSLEVWEPLPDMAQPRCNAASVAWHQRLFVCGGCRSGSVEVLSLSGGHWEELHLPGSQRQDVGVVALAAGCLYICGGASGQAAIAAAERLKASEEVTSWESLEPMSRPRARACGFLSPL